MRAFLPTILPLFWACESEKGVTIHNSEPTVTITSHTNGTLFLEGVEYTLIGQVSDQNHSNQELLVVWSTDERTLCPETPPNTNGETVCQTTLNPSETTIKIQVTDPDGAAAVTDITIEVQETEPPVVSILSPTTNASYYSDQLIHFSAIIHDEEDTATDLEYKWESSIDGELELNTPPDASGSISGYLTLSEGLHAISLRVTDTTGKTTNEDVAIEVGAQNSPPSCNILLPESGSGVLVGQNIEFSAMVADEDIENNLLHISWESNIDGLFDTTAANTAGEVDLVYNGLSIGNHTITLKVEDEVGASCSDTVLISIGTAPTLNLVTPISGSVVTLGESVGFSGIVEDQEDIASNISISWESDIDGVFSTQSSDSSGNIAFGYSDFSSGLHNITVTATDSDGLTALVALSLLVNTPPDAPTVNITPLSPVTSDTLTASATGADADGDTLSFSYAWSSSNGGIYSGATLPSTETTGGETWTVSVIANDGYIDGAPQVASVVIENTEPRIDSISLTPATPSKNDTVICSATTSDLDGDTPVLTFAWTNTTTNSEYMSSSSTTTSSSLDLSAIGTLSTGDNIECVATATDMTGASVSDNAVVEIVNSAPSFISSATIQPNSGVLTNTVLVCSATATDPNDGALSPTYEWHVGNTLIETGNTYTVLASDTDVGDTITCIATAEDSDGEIATSSSSVSVENTPPVLSGTSFSQSTVYNDDVLVCSSVVTDPDESLSISYTWMLEGNLVETSNTLDLSTTAAMPQDTLECTATTVDTQGFTDTQTVSTLISNRAPSAPTVHVSPASPIEGIDDLNCTIDVASVDADGHNINYTYSWTMNGVVQSSLTTSTVTGTNTTAGEIWMCSVTPNDSIQDGSVGQSSVSIRSGSAINNCQNVSTPEDLNLGFAYTYHSLAVDSSGHIFVVGSQSEIIRIDGVTWERSCFGESPCGTQNKNIITANDGNLLLLCSDSVHHINTATAAASSISTDALHTGPSINNDLEGGIVQKSNNDIYISQENRLLHINYNTGERTIISGGSVGGGDSFPANYDRSPLVLDSSEDVYMLGAGEHIHIDTSMGIRTKVNYVGCSGTGLNFPEDVTQLSDGSLYTTYRYIPWYFGHNGDTVCSSIQNHDLSGSIANTSGFSGNRNAVVFHGDGTEFLYPTGIAAGPDDMLYIMDSNIPAVLMVDPLTGDRTQIGMNALGDGPGFADPRAILYASDGYIYVVDAGPHQHYGHRAIIRVDPTNGDRTWITSNWIGTGPVYNYYGNYPTELYFDNGTLFTNTLDVDVVTGNRSYSTAMTYEDPVRTTTSSGTYTIGTKQVYHQSSSGNTLISGNGIGNGVLFQSIAGITSLPDGTIIVSDNILDILIAVDPNTGDRTLFSGFGNY